jgi:hypothetical protein
MEDTHRRQLVRYLCGALCGGIVAVAIINWTPSKIPDYWVEHGDQAGQYSVLDITNWYALFGAPFTWPAQYVQHQVNFGCSSDSEATGCYGSMDEINAGRIYVIILLALYAGQLFLYWPNKHRKNFSELMQAIVFLITAAGVFLPFWWFFPEIIQHNSSSLYSPAIALALIYLPAGLMGIYEIIRDKFKKRTSMVRLTGGIMLMLGLLVSILLYGFFGFINGF